MRASTSIAALAVATGAFAQLPSQVTNLLGSLSSGCQQTVLQLAVSSELSQCLHVQQVLPIVTSVLSNSTSNASLLPSVDQLINIECSQAGCSNATLTAAARDLESSCSSDLQKYNVANGTIRTIFAQYPLAREVICLKTSIPYNLTDAPLAIAAPTFNVTNGTAYCATSLLTEVSAKVGENITVPFITDLVRSAQNNTLQQYASDFNLTDLCNDCIFGAADLIGVAYPTVGNVSLESIGFPNVTLSNANRTNVSNVTISQVLNSTCAAEGYTWTNNGTLPSTIRLSAVNSTFTLNTTATSNTTSRPSSTPVRRNVVDIKARWIGQQ